MTPIVLLCVIIILSLIFDFLNGFHDSANVVATIISSRAMSAKLALGLAAFANFIGPFVFGVAVAKTIGHDITLPNTINIYVVIAALFSASVWNLITWYYGIPSSSSHALIGGIIGAVVVGNGFDVLKIAGIIKILIALFLSPILGFTFGWLIMSVIKRILKNSSPQADVALKNWSNTYCCCSCSQSWYE
jgi:PiT family inorganic phosphate transporter